MGAAMKRSSNHEELRHDAVPDAPERFAGTGVAPIGVSKSWIPDAEGEAKRRLFRPDEGMRVVESIPSYDDWR